MRDKIAVEEHYAGAETLADSQRYGGGYWADTLARLPDFEAQRLPAMDRAGIARTVLSLNAPAVQAIPDRARAIEAARAANDALAGIVARHPDRFSAVAALPMQDAEAAARELRRCVNDLGFKGALVNGFTVSADGSAPIYYDLAQFQGFWDEVAALDVPFYLHPRDALPPDSRIYEGHAWLRGSVWGFATETATHALRLMCSGLFDRHPGLQIVLGHLGEHIPFDIWRIQHRMQYVPNVPAQRKLGSYLRENFHVTTSGNFCTESLRLALSVMGPARVMFAVDYPFEAHDHAAGWFDAAELDDTVRRQIGRDNARRLFRLPE